MNDKQRVRLALRQLEEAAGEKLGEAYALSCATLIEDTLDHYEGERDDRDQRIAELEQDQKDLHQRFTQWWSETPEASFNKWMEDPGTHWTCEEDAAWQAWQHLFEEVIFDMKERITKLENERLRAGGFARNTPNPKNPTGFKMGDWFKLGNSPFVVIGEDDSYLYSVHPYTGGWLGVFKQEPNLNALEHISHPAPQEALREDAEQHDTGEGLEVSCRSFVGGLSELKQAEDLRAAIRAGKEEHPDD